MVNCQWWSYLHLKILNSLTIYEISVLLVPTEDGLEVVVVTQKQGKKVAQPGPSVAQLLDPQINIDHNPGMSSTVG